MKNLQVVGSLVGGVGDYKKMLEFVEKHGIEVICE
jgi:D-arabinose 1-dehydrogenase-like Zn-dependent alcohol dehydrogenase